MTGGLAPVRDGAHPVLPNSDTVIQEGDLLVLAAPTFEERAGGSLREVTVNCPLSPGRPAPAAMAARQASVCCGDVR